MPKIKGIPHNDVWHINSYMLDRTLGKRHPEFTEKIYKNRMYSTQVISKHPFYAQCMSLAIKIMKMNCGENVQDHNSVPFGRILWHIFKQSTKNLSHHHQIYYPPQNLSGTYI